jgi:hypothetical protein
VSARTKKQRKKGKQVPIGLTTGPHDALVIVDPQNDFLPGGALPVPAGNRIFAPINALMPRFARVRTA